MFSTLLSCGDVEVQPMSCLYSRPLEHWGMRKPQGTTAYMAGKATVSSSTVPERWVGRERKKADSSFMPFPSYSFRTNLT